MSRNYIAIAAALSLAALLPACQSSSVETPADACARAKAAGDRNTAIGQVRIKSNCQPGGAASMSGEDYYREHTRQQKCLAETGRVCQS